MSFRKKELIFHQMLQTYVLNEWLTGRDLKGIVTINYYPIQGQMTISGRIFWAFEGSDFVVYTNKGKFIERVLLDTDL